MKFVHAADLHLDSPLHGIERYEGMPVSELRGATRRAFENLISLCLGEKVDFLCLAGDIYDGNWRDYNTGLFFASQVARLRQAGIPVYLVRGNHDAESQITKKLRLPQNVIEFDSARPETHCLDPIKVAVHGQSFAEPAITYDLSQAYPERKEGYFNIGLLHTSVTGREGHAAYAPCQLSSLIAKGYEYWALGHVHAREILNEAPWVVFPGNLQGRHVRETGEKGCTLVFVEEGRVMRLEHRTLDVVRWAHLKIDVFDCDTESAILERLRDAFENELRRAEGRVLAMRVELTGAPHQTIGTGPASFLNNVRSLLNDVGQGRACLEKLKIRTKVTLPGSHLLKGWEDREGPEGPLEDLIRNLEELKVNKARWDGLLDEFADLKSRLPAEMREGADPLVLEDPGFLKSSLEEAEQLLISKLLVKTGLDGGPTN